MTPSILYTYTNQRIYIYQYEIIDGKISEVTITPDINLAHVFTDMELVFKIKKHYGLVLKGMIPPTPKIWFNLI